MHVAQAFVWPSSPERAKRALQGSDVAERRAAALALGDMAEATAEPLLRLALGDSDTDVRLSAAKSAVRLRSTSASEAVIPWLSDSDVKVRLAACELIRLRPHSACRAGPGAGLGRSRRRRSAGGCFCDGGQRGARGGGAPARSPRRSVGERAGRNRAGPRAHRRISAAVPLIGKIGDGAPEVRRAVARALGELGDPRASMRSFGASRSGAFGAHRGARGARSPGFGGSGVVHRSAARGSHLARGARGRAHRAGAHRFRCRGAYAD